MNEELTALVSKYEVSGGSDARLAAIFALISTLLNQPASASSGASVNREDLVIESAALKSEFSDRMFTLQNHIDAVQTRFQVIVDGLQSSLNQAVQTASASAFQAFGNRLVAVENAILDIKTPSAVGGSAQTTPIV